MGKFLWVISIGSVKYRLSTQKNCSNFRHLWLHFRNNELTTITTDHNIITTSHIPSMKHSIVDDLSELWTSFQSEKSLHALTGKHISTCCHPDRNKKHGWNLIWNVSGQCMFCTTVCAILAWQCPSCCKTFMNITQRRAVSLNDNHVIHLDETNIQRTMHWQGNTFDSVSQSSPRNFLLYFHLG